ncbi:TPA: hypothetical protein ACWMKV_004633 [Escherichia coli]|uniref:hypothetical protein n=1 Tax=Escherichia coli TaxID=562 RepID=UPI000BE9E419|nr:hypothetical protein [Escherichia coli]EAR8154407.1 hypothetical protein [Salmonella enterica]EGN8951044.1 hypothetical protein [Shigella flexneri]ELJ2015983.1 hypothetical protein [Enterobacter hormaechei]EBD2739407.1 hypothetical protein [Salmonella enterica]EBM5833785.1 hypothetical protein [Salmonella enterica]
MANAPLDRGAFINPKKVIIMASRGVNKVILVGNLGQYSRSTCPENSQYWDQLNSFGFFYYKNQHFQVVEWFIR